MPRSAIQLLPPPPDFSIEQEKLKDGAVYNRIKLRGIQRVSQLGAPSLPVRYVNLLVPPQSKITRVTVQSNKEKTIQLNNLIEPVQPPIPTAIDYEQPEFIPPDPAIYKTGKPFPRKRIKVVDKGHARGNKIVTLAVYPFEYHPLKNELSFSASQTIQLEYEKAPAKKLSGYRKSMNKKRDLNLLQSMVDNKTDVAKYNVWETVDENKMTQKDPAAFEKSVDVGYEYVIITSQELSSAFDEFMAWKRRKGIDIGVVTIEAIKNNYNGDPVSGIYDNAGKLRHYLKDAYDYGLEYALLAGDNTVLPIRYGTGADDTWTSKPNASNDYKIPADLYFSDFDGDWAVDEDGVIDGDKYYGEPEDNVEAGPEIFVGRLLCSTTDQIQKWTDKVLKYERNPGNGDNSYLTKAFYTQADELQKYEKGDYIADQFSGVYPSNKYTFWEEEYNDSSNYDSPGTPEFPKGRQAVNKMNERYGLISWFNHGSALGVSLAAPGLNKCKDEGKRKLTYKDEYPGSCGIPELKNGLDKLTNTNHPSIVYTVACTTTPFDNYRHAREHKNMGESFTVLNQSGGPNYLGNTRYGYVSPSTNLFNHFIDAIINSHNHHFGEAEAISKQNYSSHYLRLSHNLIGCPETELWTDIPSEFSGVEITEENGDVTVNTGGVSGSNICVMSSDDGGDSYWDAAKDVSSHTFSNVPKPYYVTVTKHDYLPYMEEITCPNSLTISNEGNVTSQTTFSLQEDFPNGSMQWSHSNNLVYVSGQGTSSYTVKPKDNVGGGTGWVKVSIQGCNVETKINFYVGNEDYTLSGPNEIPVMSSGVALIHSFKGSSKNIANVAWSKSGAIERIIGGTNKASFLAGRIPGPGYIYADITSTSGNTYYRSLYVQVTSQNPYSVYPNPATEYLNVKLQRNKISDKFSNEPATIRLFNKNQMNLVKIQTIEGSQGKLFTGDLQPGIYLLQITLGKKTYKENIAITE